MSDDKYITVLEGAVSSLQQIIEGLEDQLLGRSDLPVYVPALEGMESSLQKEMGRLADRHDVDVDALADCTLIFVAATGHLFAAKARRPNHAKIEKALQKLNKALQLDQDTLFYLAKSPEMSVAIAKLRGDTRKFDPSRLDDFTPRERMARFLLSLCESLGVKPTSYDDGFVCQWIEVINTQLSTPISPHETGKTIVKIKKSK